MLIPKASVRVPGAPRLYVGVTSYSVGTSVLALAILSSMVISGVALPLALIAPFLLAQAPPVWQRDYAQVETRVNGVRAGRDLTPKRWPQDARVTVAFSFETDNETGFLGAELA